MKSALVSELDFSSDFVLTVIRDTICTVRLSNVMT